MVTDGGGDIEGIGDMIVVCSSVVVIVIGGLCVDVFVTVVSIGAVVQPAIIMNAKSTPIKRRYFIFSPSFLVKRLFPLLQFPTIEESTKKRIVLLRESYY